MSRIRSVHPKLFTDDAFAQLSDAAQVFLIGLWVEADDHGIFEWKPFSLRLRIRPGRDGDVEPLMAEIERMNCIRRYEVGERSYGAVRNFCKFQRPKKPTFQHPMPEDIGTYVACEPPKPTPDAGGAGEVLHQFGTGGEIGEQREEGGGNRREESLEDLPSDSESPESSKTPRAAKNGPGYAFRGRVIRLTNKDYDTWKNRFHAIPDLSAELEKLDSFYSELAKDDQKKWFVRCCAALDKKHQEYVLARASQAKGRNEFGSPGFA